MSEESFNRSQAAETGAGTGPPEQASPNAGAADGTERRRSLSGVQSAAPATPEDIPDGSQDLGNQDESEVGQTLTDDQSAARHPRC